MAALQNLLSDAAVQQAVVYALALLGLMDVFLWFLREFVTWTHRVRLLVRKLIAEPDTRTLHD